MFVSRLPANMPIIDDETPVAAVCPAEFGRGLNFQDRDDPFGGLAEPFPLPTIPRGEWAERIELSEKTGSRLFDMKRHRGFKSLNQGQTNYCWANGVIAAMHYARAVQGLPHVALSPASVAAPIKNYQNRGGWGSEALKYIIEHGVAPQSAWPANAIDRQYVQPSAVVRKKYKVVEWWELRPRNFEQLVSCLLYRVPIAVGYNWWGHEVMAHDVVVLGRDEFGIMIDNSWGTNWGDHGHSVLTGAKALPDEAVAPRFLIPHAKE